MQNTDPLKELLISESSLNNNSDFHQLMTDYSLEWDYQTLRYKWEYGYNFIGEKITMTTSKV